jgi:hypothetical protein
MWRSDERVQRERSFRFAIARNGTFRFTNLSVSAIAGRPRYSNTKIRKVVLVKLVVDK